jgi:hypothetical protein
MGVYVGFLGMGTLRLGIGYLFGSIFAKRWMKMAGGMVLGWLAWYLRSF